MLGFITANKQGFNPGNCHLDSIARFDEKLARFVLVHGIPFFLTFLFKMFFFKFNSVVKKKNHQEFSKYDKKSILFHPEGAPQAPKIACIA